MRVAAALVWVIVHMANSVDAVKWGASIGANGIEADLRFDAAGAPTEFHHGAPCDCSCFIGYGVCKHLGSSPCASKTAASTLLQTVAAQPAIGLVVIDSKVTALTNPKAGTNVVGLLDTALFANGYKGVVIVSSPMLDTFAYLEAAATAAAKSPNGSRIYFTIDGEGKNVVPVLEKLTRLSSPNVVYGTGLSACLPANFHDQIALAAVNRDAGVIGFDYIWTIDKDSSASGYLAGGANAIMTNSPESVIAVAKKDGYTLAPAGTTFPPATSKDVIKSAPARLRVPKS